MQQGLTLVLGAILLLYQKEPMNNRCANFQRSPTILNVWLNGCAHAVSLLLPWNQQEFTGFQSLSSLSVMVLKSGWSMPAMSRMSLAERATSWTANGYSSCIHMACYGALFVRLIRFVRYEHMFDNGQLSYGALLPISSVCRSRLLR